MSWCKWLGITESEAVETLLDTLSWCHQSAALANNNASSGALVNAAACGAKLESAVASALLTLGDVHGPVAASRKLLYSTINTVIVKKLEDEELLPGWGNSFYKKSIDPSFVPLDHLIRDQYHEHRDRLDKVAELIFKVTGKTLYPNAAAFTAICAELLSMARGTEVLLFIACRLPAWAKQYVRATS